MLPGMRIVGDSERRLGMKFGRAEKGLFHIVVYAPTRVKEVSLAGRAHRTNGASFGQIYSGLASFVFSSMARVGRVAQYAGDPGVLGIIRIVIYLFYYPYFIMTPGPCGLRTTTSEDDNL